MTPKRLPLGPLMIGVEGTGLGAADRERLLHPAVGGVIFFARNVESPVQVADLATAVRNLREPALLIGVDQEGGRVRRFRDGFSPIPPMAALGRVWDGSGREAAILAARDTGRLLGMELRALGVDVDFAPCVDLDHGVSAVIGDRAFHREPEVVAVLGTALWEGMAAEGLAGTAKHFPGHGAVTADSHAELPLDRRHREEIFSTDLVPFRRLVMAGIPGVMAAHCLYPAVDDRPAGFSRRWLGEILRGQLGFGGAIVSDDLGMGGAEGFGAMPDRAMTALEAGCDLLLVCNDFPGMEAAADAVLRERWRVDGGRLEGLRGKGIPTAWGELAQRTDYRRLGSEVAALG